MGRQAEDLVRIGARFSTPLLLEQAAVSERQAREARAELGERFPLQRIERLRTLGDDIRALYADRALAEAERRVLTGAQADLFQAAKDWVRNLRDAAANAFDGDEEKLDAYSIGPRVGQSVPRLLTLMQQLIRQARQDSAALAGEGFFADDIDQGQQLLERLRQTDAEQEQAIKSLPVKTRDLYAKKGELVLLLKQLVRAARRTWRRDVARANAFALNILKRGAGLPPQQAKC